MSEQQNAAQTAETKFDQASFPLRAILGQKVGMTQVFDDFGHRIPVSVISTDSCLLTQLKTVEKDGYNAVQLGIGSCKEKNLTKPYLNQFKKNNISPVRWLKEFKVAETAKFQIGQKVPLEVFGAGDYVDISGTSKGKGFAGVMKRHNFGGLPHSHGASNKERSRGASGGGSGEPQRLFKGTKMAGRTGQDWITTCKVEVVRVDKDNQLILVKGSIPGAVGSFVVLKETVKAVKKKRAVIAQKVGAKAAAVAGKKPGKK